MNVNALRDADNDPGFYVAATSAAKNWPGAILYQSSDGGASFQSIATLTARATMGMTLSTLGNYFGGNTVDELNTVDVRLYSGALSSVTYEGLLEGVQAALIGDELVYFRSAHLNANRTYTLRGFLRGRRGTEHEIKNHGPGERFVLLTPANIKRITQSTADIGKTRLYKAVTSGQKFESVQAKPFTNEGAALKPYAPVHIGGGRLVDGSLPITWVRRSRISGEWRDYVDIPVGEEIELYEIEICSFGFESVVRAVTVKDSTSYMYDAAAQIEDFGSLQPVLYVRIFQISATVGRGYPATAII